MSVKLIKIKNLLKIIKLTDTAGIKPRLTDSKGHIPSH